MYCTSDSIKPGKSMLNKDGAINNDDQPLTLCLGGGNLNDSADLGLEINTSHQSNAVKFWWWLVSPSILLVSVAGSNVRCV